MTGPLPLDARERALLAELGDRLIPPAPGRLSASQAGIAGALMAAIEEHVPERLALLRTVVDRARRDGAGTALAGLKAEDTATYDAFCETIAAAYFMAPEVREGVGFPGRVAVAARADAADMADLLLPVLEAGFAPRGYSG
jgi:hypothetical protein